MVSQNEGVIRPRGPLERFFEGLHRYRYFLAPLSFGIGVASFLLIQRTAWIAQWLAVLLLVTWVASVLEVIVPRRAPPGLMRFITQQTHQEAFFFTLPFLLKTTSWHTGQAVFTSGVILAALASMWDPIYFGFIATRRWLYLAFHAAAVYLVILVSLPLLLHLTTAQTLGLAAAAVALVAAPTLGSPPEGAGRGSGLLLFAGALVLAAASWYGRAWVPPTTLWVGDSAITTAIDVARRAPVERIDAMTVTRARERGVFAFTAIVVPRGLREKVIHRWRTQGEPDFDVPMEITGGREQGYRAWTHKTGFTEPGRWRVQVITESGQLLGELRFEVVPDSAPERIEAVPAEEFRPPVEEIEAPVEQAPPPQPAPEPEPEAQDSAPLPEPEQPPAIEEVPVRPQENEPVQAPAVEPQPPSDAQDEGVEDGDEEETPGDVELPPS